MLAATKPQRIVGEKDGKEEKKVLLPIISSRRFKSQSLTFPHSAQKYLPAFKSKPPLKAH